MSSSKAKQLAKRFKQAREQADLSQTELAHALGVVPQAVQHVESGRVAKPKFLPEAAKYLGVSYDWLLSGEQKDEPSSKKTERVGLVFSPEEVKAIDDWRRKQEELPSRSEAIRRLIKMALKSKAK